MAHQDDAARADFMRCFDEVECALTIDQIKSAGAAFSPNGSQVNDRLHTVQRHPQRRWVNQATRHHVDANAGRQAPLLVGRAHQAAHLVAGSCQPRHNALPHKSGCPSDENHCAPLVKGLVESLDRPSPAASQSPQARVRVDRHRIPDPLHHRQA